MYGAAICQSSQTLPFFPSPFHVIINPLSPLQLDDDDDLHSMNLTARQQDILERQSSLARISIPGVVNLKSLIKVSASYLDTSSHHRRSDLSASVLGGA